MLFLFFFPFKHLLEFLYRRRRRKIDLFDNAYKLIKLKMCNGMANNGWNKKINNKKGIIMCVIIIQQSLKRKNGRSKYYYVFLTKSFKEEYSLYFTLTYKYHQSYFDVIYYF